MRTLTFTLDTQTGDDAMAPATVTVSELDDGTLSFTVTNEGDGDNLIGDLRALFFDVADDALLGTLSTLGADITEVDQSGDVVNLGGGATASGVPNGSYEVGIEFGTSGQSTDDIQTTSFVLSSFLRALTLDDLALESFTVRQTSVGEVDGDRSASDKLYGDAPYPVNAIDDAVIVNENEVLAASVFSNDIDLDAPDSNADGIADLTVTSVDGDAQLVDQEINFAQGISFTLNADGVLSVDASGADYLSAGEVLTGSSSYSVYDGNGGSDSATITISVTGVNDAPLALADLNDTDEATLISGNVLSNDSDVDRLDAISVISINGDPSGVGNLITLASGAQVALNEDGTYSYNPNGAFDHLNAGETGTDSFTYSITDNHGATSEASVEISIAGIGGDVGGGDGIPEGDHFGTFANKKGTADHAISNIVLYLKDDGDDITKVKIDGWDGGETDLDNVNLNNFITNNYASYDVMAVSIKAGNNHNKDLGPGEGQLFLIDGDSNIDYVAGGDAPAGLTHQDLEAHADITFDYSASLFG